MNQKTKGKKISFISYILIALWFAVIVLKILNFSQIFKIIYSEKNFYYIAPTSKSLVLFGISIIIELILLFYIFNKNKPKTAVIIISVVALLSANVISFSSYDYISQNEIKLEQNILYENINQIEVYIIKSPLATGSKALYTAWIIECKIHCYNLETIITSDEFFNISMLNELLNKFNPDIVKINIENVDDLIEFYSRKNIFSSDSKDEINSINEIFNS